MLGLLCTMMLAFAGTPEQDLADLDQRLRALDGVGAEPIARAHLDRVLARGKQDPELPEAYSSVAKALQYQERFAEAEQWFLRCKEALEAQDAPEPRSLSMVSMHLGHVVLLQGDLARAGALLEAGFTALEHDDTLLPENKASIRVVYGDYLRRTGDYPRAAELYEQALALEDERLADDDPGLVPALNGLAQTLLLQSELDRSLALLERARDLLANDPDNPKRTVVLSNLAHLHLVRGELDEGIALVEETIHLVEARDGPDHPNVAVLLNNLGMMLQEQGYLSAAVPLMERALAIKEATLPPGDPRLAISLNNMAHMQWTLAHYTEARALLERALTVLERALGPDHPYTTGALNNLATLLTDQGDLAGADAMFADVLSRWEQSVGVASPQYATTLMLYSNVREYQGRYEDMLALQEQAWQVRLRVLGERHPDTFQALGSMAEAEVALGRLTDARTHIDQAVTGLESVLGPDSPVLAMYLQRRGSIALHAGDMDQARSDLTRAMALRSGPGTGPQARARARSGLAAYHARVGELEEARVLLEQALDEVAGSESAFLVHTELMGQLVLVMSDMGDHDSAVRASEAHVEDLVSRFGEQHPETADALANHGVVLDRAGDNPGAVQAYRQALAAMRATLGPDHPRLATVLANLGGQQTRAGDLDGAEASYLEALALFQAESADHPRTATLQVNLARLRLQQERPDEARALSEQALVALEATYGPEHPVLVHPLHTLALVATDADEARALMDRALAIAEAHHRLLDQLSERESVAYLEDQLPTWHSWMFFHTGAEHAKKAWAATLRWKGAVTRRVQQRHEALQGADAETWQRLQSVRRQRAALVTIDAPPTAEQHEQLRMLAEEAEALERALTSASGSQGGDPTPEQVCANIPDDTVLLDFVQLEDSERTTLSVFVVDPSCSVTRLELGAVDALALAHQDWRESLLSPGSLSSRVDERGLRLTSRLWTPIEPLLDGVDTVWISPDGLLASLPWAALPMTDGHHLVQHHTVQLVPLPSQLGTPATRAQGLLAVGGVTFGSSALAPLPGTEREVQAVARTWRHSAHRREPIVQLTGVAANESAVAAALPGKRLVHLATHGFFETGGDDPMLSSGLVLAPEPDSDVATELIAEEVALLDLAGTELVVLSACETGLGNQTVGVGVQGLQRAMAIAGVEALVMTLWSVDDEASAELMDAFYRHLLDRRNPLPPARALREAQLERLRALRQSYGEARPQDWAGFTVSVRAPYTAR